VNVCTIEDPIEMVEPAFNQMQVHQAIDLGFAEGVRALMRQDPDIIMVGEIRDLETAEMAIQAALTGHLVLSTLHTNDAPSAVTRMLDLGCRPICSTPPCSASWPSAWCASCAPTASSPSADPEEEAIWDHLVTPWKAPRPAASTRPWAASNAA
jgi:general secretion pathway protein E